MQRTHYLLIFLFSVLFSTASFAQPKAYLAHKFFENSKQQPYLEVYFDFSASSLTEKINIDSTKTQNVLLTAILLLNDSVVGFDKKQIQSPEVTSREFVPDFISVLKIQAIHQKSLRLQLDITDLNNPDTAKNNTSVTIPIKAYPNSKGVHLSDIQFLSKYEKSSSPSELNKGGYLLSPYISDYYGESLNQIQLYTEAYFPANILTESTDYVAYLQVTNPNTHKVFNDIRSFVKIKGKLTVPFISTLDISKLPSGNFLFELEIRDKENKMLCKQSVPFNRSNPQYKVPLADLDEIFVKTSFVGTVTQIEEMREFINALRPIASDKEKFKIDNQDGTFPSLLAKQQFFLGFWMERNATNPDIAWQDYYEKVKVVNQLFPTNIKRGYMTDRGRIYLRFGPPNHRTVSENETSAYPYEIWQYYRAGTFNNIRFLFYDRDLVNNDYILLHSNYPGEIKNQNWKNELYKRTNKGTVGGAPIDNGFGDRVDDFFANPR
jgi:GWxTD domain-containing protein